MIPEIFRYFGSEKVQSSPPAFFPLRAPRSRRGDGADEDDYAEAEGRRREWCSKALTSNTSGGHERFSGGRSSLFRPAHPGRTGPGAPREERRAVVDWDAGRARRARASRERDDGTHVENRGGDGEEEGASAAARARRRALRDAHPEAEPTTRFFALFAFSRRALRDSSPRLTLSLTLPSPACPRDAREEDASEPERAQGTRPRRFRARDASRPPRERERRAHREASFPQNADRVFVPSSVPSSRAIIRNVPGGERDAAPGRPDDPRGFLRANARAGDGDGGEHARGRPHTKRRASVGGARANGG